MADFNSKYTGEQVEALLDIVSQGGGGEGGGGTITEAEITAMGFTKNLGTITEVKMNGASKGTSGVVDLGTVLTEHQDISGKADKSSLATVATSGSYSDLSNKPTIPAAVTESTVSGWGFTKNTGNYSKPSGGIPASDLASDVFLQGEKGEQGPKGDDGIGIASVAQTTSSSADGGSNVMTVTLSNGTKSTFTVKNGSKGSQGEQGPKGDTGADGPKGDKGDKGDTGPEGPKGDKGDKGDTGATGATGANGTNGKDGTDGEDGATFTPSVDSNGNLSWTNNKGLTNPPTVNIKGPKGDSGEGGGTSSDGRKEVIYFDGEGTITSMRPNVIYWIVGFWDVSIESFEEPVYGVDTYDVFTAIIEMGHQSNDPVSLTLPDYIWWANGVIPEIVSGTYELSISRISDGDYTQYYAVLTPFKLVE